MAGYEGKLICTHCGYRSTKGGWLDGYTTLTLKAVNFGGQGGSQADEFGSQGGTQDVVEEWLKEDEHRDGVKKEEKCGTHQRWCGKEEKIDK